MIDLYTWTTPNGRKVSILLEELGVPYKVHAIDITKDEQFAPDFLKIAPNNRIPAIVDQETGLQLMESGAIMMYLADKYKKFQCEGPEYWRMVEWLMWQMGGLGSFLTAVAASGRFTSIPASFTNEAVTIKKISMINTTSSIGVISIVASSSSIKF